MPGLATYEFRHKLDSGDADHDFQLSFSAPNNRVGFSLRPQSRAE